MFLKREAEGILLNGYTHFSFVAINQVLIFFFVPSFIHRFPKEKSKNVFYIYAHFVQHVGCGLHYKLFAQMLGEKTNQVQDKRKCKIKSKEK